MARLTAFASATLLSGCAVLCGVERECDGDRVVNEVPAWLPAHCYQSASPAVRLEYQPDSRFGRVIHMGGDSPDDSIGSTVEYHVRVNARTDELFLRLLYADDVAGNVIRMSWNGEEVGRFESEATGGWNSFRRGPKVSLGSVATGERNTLSIDLRRGGSYGVIVDAIEFSDVAPIADTPEPSESPPTELGPHDAGPGDGGLEDAGASDAASESGLPPMQDSCSTCAAPDRSVSAEGAYLGFLRAMIVEGTGLPRSRPCECFTTVYKAALVAIALVEAGDLEAARRIVEFFAAAVTEPFDGFRQSIDPCTGEFMESSRWVGDLGMLAVATRHVGERLETTEFDGLLATLRAYLRERAREGTTMEADGTEKPIPAEGWAKIYAALHPFDDHFEDWQIRSRIVEGFDADFQTTIADHVSHRALVFGESSGLLDLERFRRQVPWSCERGLEVVGYADAVDGPSINFETHLQLMLGRAIFGIATPEDVANLERVRLSPGGLPYRVPATGEFLDEDALPILDSTAFAWFTLRGLNPLAPGESSAGVPASELVTLRVAEQANGFPRLHSAEQGASSFPQEINDGSHGTIVIQLPEPLPASETLSVRIATVARADELVIHARLATLDHRLASDNVALDDAASGELSATGTATYLVLTGRLGWGVFDAMELSSDGSFELTVGDLDGRCDEFDNQGFSYDACVE